MYLALEAYFKVDKVSYMLLYVGEIVAIIIVFALPPKLSCNNLVNLESRYGTNAPFPWTKLVITFPKAVKDRFIFVAYKNRSPVEPVLLCLYDPARSTKLNLDPINFSVPSFFFYKDST